nr:papain fold toxin domain-containing protein [Microcoleus sp. PH2017_30_WIL_O_A]
MAVQINGEELIFDNIHNQGISKQEWLGNFYCLAIELGGQFEIAEIEF